MLSDIHGNQQALAAVLRAAAQRGARRWWCVGDLVGYGANPVEVLNRCLTEAERCIAGNHDLGVVGRIPVGDFADVALESLMWTQARLGATGLAKLSALQPLHTDHEVPLFHASPRNPVWEYITQVSQARAALEAVPARVSFVGHTHQVALWHLGEDGAVRRVPPEGPVALTPHRWLVNPGSVGQPRDGDPRASWALLDQEEGTVEIVRTPYDVAGAQNAILNAGLPFGLATRLSEGR
ncbi:MAG: metallophosphoesterase family protein [Thermoleophilia bacterium]